ncbi:unnamed protein product [Rodentolepis nana]|uniref:Uncharacterized protein n=1 Tax=Rodentolepis nana TaxID=102285 RepID=A0A3P7S588_RODNA|nr:unnamed protein product [Rodentolepis nana]
MEGAFYANFVFFLLMRGFLFSTFCITVISAFPLSQYGTILGAASTLSGIFALIQYGLILPKPKIANSIALILAFLLFIPPTIIYIMSSKALKKLPSDVFEKDTIEDNLSSIHL